MSLHFRRLLIRDAGASECQAVATEGAADEKTGGEGEVFLKGFRRICGREISILIHWRRRDAGINDEDDERRLCHQEKNEDRKDDERGVQSPVSHSGVSFLSFVSLLAAEKFDARILLVSVI